MLRNEIKSMKLDDVQKLKLLNYLDEKEKKIVEITKLNKTLENYNKLLLNKVLDYEDKKPNKITIILLLLFIGLNAINFLFN